MNAVRIAVPCHRSGLSVLAIVASLATCFAPAPHAADGVAVLNVSVASGPALPLGNVAERWTTLIGEDAQKRFAAKLHPGASLAQRDAAREFAALKEGKADLAVGSALQWSLQLPALAVYALPWIAPDRRALEALAASESLFQALASRMHAHGVVLVAVAPLGYRALATTARAVRAPSDLSGLRLRASPLPLVHDLLLALGARPQAMSFAEAQAAFAKGELDGQEGAPSALAAARAAVGGQRHLTDWGAVGDAMLFAVRRPVWDGWSADQRDSIRLYAAQAAAQTNALAREDAAMRQLQRNGMAIVRITPAGHDAFRAAVRDLHARWREAIGGDIVDIAESALATLQPAKPSKPAS